MKKGKKFKKRIIKLKEERTLKESNHKIVDGVDVTEIVDDLFENHSWLMKKLGS